VLIYKWIDETGKTKKAFTVDLPENAKQIYSENSIKDQNSGVSSQDVPPSIGTDGSFTFETHTTTYITQTEIIIIQTTKILLHSGTGGTILHDVVVTVTRVAKPPIESDKD